MQDKNWDGTNVSWIKLQKNTYKLKITSFESVDKYIQSDYRWLSRFATLIISSANEVRTKLLAFNKITMSVQLSTNARYKLVYSLHMYQYRSLPHPILLAACHHLHYHHLSELDITYKENKLYEFIYQPKLLYLLYILHRAHSAILKISTIIFNHPVHIS